MTCRILQNNDEKHRDFAEKKHLKTNLDLEELQILILTIILVVGAFSYEQKSKNHSL